VREIPGVSAILVPPRDVKALTAAVKEKLYTLSAGHGAGNGNGAGVLALQHQIRRQFDMSRMVRETWEVYQHTLRN
jgi:hypothetical protein